MMSIARLPQIIIHISLHPWIMAVFTRNQDFPEGLLRLHPPYTSVNHPCSPSTRRYPVNGLDFPNDSKKPDYELRFE